MELFSYYSMCECLDRKFVIKELRDLKDEGKVEFSVDGDILKIADIDLDDYEIKDLAKMLDANDVFVDTDYEDDNDDFDDLEDYIKGDDDDDY